MGREVSKEEADEILSETRHSELTGLLSALTAVITESVNKGISLHEDVIKGFAEAIKKLPEPKVNVRVINDGVERSINSLSESIKNIPEKKINVILEKPTESNSYKKISEDIIKHLVEVRDQLIEYNKPREITFVRGKISRVIEKATLTIKK